MLVLVDGCGRLPNFGARSRYVDAPVVERSERGNGTGGMLAQHALDLICEVFVPLVRIDRIEETTVVAAIRGGALTRPEQSVRRWQVPTQVQVGDVLQPILLRATAMVESDRME